MPLRALLATLAIVGGCAGAATHAEKTMNPTPTLQYTRGQSLAPADDLLRWLQGTGSQGKMVRLPVVMRFEDTFRFGIHEAYIAGANDEVSGDSIALDLDDTGMSVGVMDRIRDQVPADDLTCVFWLEGTWGPLVDLPLPEMPDEPPDTREVFAVRKVGEPVAQGTGTHAFVENP